jgi:CheY-like chemotaxis protein
LVADDTPSTRDFLRFVLTSAGAEVVLAENGAEAVELASLACPDLVLIDIEMPVLNGYDAISQLRARGVRAPILVLSGHMDEEQKRRSDQVGATGFISKNHTKSEILRALAAYVSGSGEGERPSLSQDQTSAYARLALKYLDRFDSTVPKALVAAQKGEWRKLQELIHPLAAGTMFGFQRLTEGVREVAAALCALQDAQALARERVQKLSELGSSIDNDRTRLRQLVSPVAEPPEEVKTPDLALLPDSE